MSAIALSVGSADVDHAPLVQSLRFERVDAVDVRDVKQGLVAGWVGGHLHQNLIQKQRLETERFTVSVC